MLNEALVLNKFFPAMALVVIDGNHHDNWMYRVRSHQ